MSLRIMADLLQGSEEWHDARRGIVTASTVSQLLSVGPPSALTVACPTCSAVIGDPCLNLTRKTPTPIKTLHDARTAATADLPPVISVADNETSRGLTLTLVAERITGFTEPTWTTFDMQRGMEDEPRARDKYRETHAPVTECGFMVRDEEGWQLGWSPDGLVGDVGAIEIKSRRQKKHLRTILDDEVPAENVAQCQAALLVSGREWVDYVSYCGGMPLYVKRVEPDPKWHRAIVAAVAEFEQRADEMVNAYVLATAGLPTTERVLSMEVVI